MTKQRTVPATLARLTPGGIRWLDSEQKRVIAECGMRLGRTTLLRAITDGLARARFSLAGVRAECEIADRIVTAFRASDPTQSHMESRESGNRKEAKEDA